MPSVSPIVSQAQDGPLWSPVVLAVVACGALLVLVFGVPSLRGWLRERRSDRRELRRYRQEDEQRRRGGDGTAGEAGGRGAGGDAAP